MSNSRQPNQLRSIPLQGTVVPPGNLNATLSVSGQVCPPCSTSLSGCSVGVDPSVSLLTTAKGIVVPCSGIASAAASGLSESQGPVSVTKKARMVAGCVPSDFCDEMLDDEDLMDFGVDAVSEYGLDLPKLNHMAPEDAESQHVLGAEVVDVEHAKSNRVPSKGSRRNRNLVRQWFLTYPKCDATRETLLMHLQGLGPIIQEYVICQENHEDGTPHLHCYVKFDLPGKTVDELPYFVHE